MNIHKATHNNRFVVWMPVILKGGWKILTSHRALLTRLSVWLNMWQAIHLLKEILAVITSSKCEQADQYYNSQTVQTLSNSFAY